MKKLKDFIYDYNDVLVALVIVVVAGFIIFWRVNVVMSYAQYAGNETIKQIDIDFSDIDLNQENIDPEVNPEIENSDNNPAQSSDVTTGGVVEVATQPAVETTTPAVEPKPETPPVDTAKKYKLEVSKKEGTTNWTACAKRLEQNGIIKSSKDFVARVVARQVESALQPGTFEVTSTMTTDEIIDILIKK
ncbi:MAG: hypothetical protein Q4E99_05070 [Bacillota bacterium]|nr:hypothetical protein [Bacillota bacterium]